MVEEQSINNTWVGILVTDTSVASIDRYDTSAYFPHIMVTRNGRNQTLLDACQNGYEIRCASHYSTRRLMSYNESLTVESPSFRSQDFFLFVTIAIVILIFIKIMKEKNNEIKRLKKEIDRRSGSCEKIIIQ